MKKILSVYFPLLVLTLLISGCSLLNFKTDPSARLAVTFATLKVIEQGDNPELRAQRVAEIAEEARAFVETDMLSLDQLETALLMRLADEDLSPSDRLLADALISAVIAELEARVGSGFLTPEQKLTVGEVLGWVSAAAGG